MLVFALEFKLGAPDAHCVLGTSSALAVSTVSAAPVALAELKFCLAVLCDGFSARHRGDGLYGDPHDFARLSGAAFLQFAFLELQLQLLHLQVAFGAELFHAAPRQVAQRSDAHVRVALAEELLRGEQPQQVRDLVAKARACERLAAPRAFARVGRHTARVLRCGAEPRLAAEEIRPLHPGKVL